MHKEYDRINEIPQATAKNIIREGCLVIEGGAFRGLYNQGVLDALMLNDINMHTVIGVSAGALAGMNYVSGQIGRSAKANLSSRFDSRFIGAKALIEEHTILNLDFLLDTYNEIDPLDRIRLDTDDREFIAVATNCLTGKPIYYDKHSCSDILDAVKASASMPYISPMIRVDGIPCLDGGCSCKIPFEYALENNFEKIIVIKTRERGFRKPDKLQIAAKEFYKDYPEFAESLSMSDIDYNRQCDELDKLEKNNRVYVIAPSSPVNVSRLEKDLNKLGDLYWLGFNDTIEQMSKIKYYLNI